MTKILSFFALILLSLNGCEKSANIDAPSCIVSQIEHIKSEPVRNPSAEVWKWEADGKVYYYITSDCCDQFNYLHDANCNVVCAPDGGITGNGDGKCPELTDVSKTLVWKDERGA